MASVPGSRLSLSLVSLEISLLFGSDVSEGFFIMSVESVFSSSGDLESPSSVLLFSF